MAPMVLTTCPITVPPRSATSLAEFASCVACRAVSPLFFTVAVSCSMEAAVCCRLDACSSVRWLRSALPVAICVLPVAMESLLCRTCPTTRASWSRMSFMPASRLDWSPERVSTSTARLPCAICRTMPLA